MPDHATRLLVLPDRDSAEAIAETVTERAITATPPTVIREALAGEDDAEDAQWLVVIEAPARGWTAETLAVLDDIASDHEGWLETEG